MSEKVFTAYILVGYPLKQLGNAIIEDRWTPPTYTFWMLEFLLRTEFYSHVFFHRPSLGAWRGQGYPKNTMKISKSVTKFLIWPSLLKTRTFTIAWMVIDRSTPFTAITNQSKLCTKEKFYILIMPKIASLNKSQEVGTHCRHASPFRSCESESF